ncbi:MAG: DUF1667 domain-containing protein [Halanaerobiaceae bacterium]
METRDIICISCPIGCRIKVTGDGEQIEEISGFQCPRGREYAREEYKNPTRVLPTTVRVDGGELPLVSVKTAAPIPKEKIIPAMDVIARIVVKAPVSLGQVIIPNLVDTGVDLVATRKVAKG